MKKIKRFFKTIKLFINEIPRVDKAIILTLLCMFFCILSLSLLQLKSIPNEIMLEMTTTNEPFTDIEKILEEELQQEQPKIQNTKITTQAFNEADRKLIHSEEAFKTLDEILQERAMAEATEKLLSAQTNASLNSVEEVKLKATSTINSPDNKVNKNSLVKFSLEGRNPRGDLPNPIFTCEASGRIVINIKVNRYGEVIETAFNQASSSSSNGCLIENALNYAQQARFNAIAENKEQTGTITYHFQGK